MPDEVMRLRSLGAAAILTKPFDPEALAAAVRDTLSRQGGAPAAPEDADRASGTSLPQPVDPAAMARLRGLETEAGGDLAVELIGLFADNTPVAIERMRALGRSADKAAVSEIERLAHSLKSAAATLGATSYAIAAKTIEDDARDGNLRALDSRLDHLSQSLDALVDQLKAERARLT
jgi:HPt (histidine-containing phosphotransfer) domain-containing protein